MKTPLHLREAHRKSQFTNTCLDCGKPIWKRSTRCSSCAAKHWRERKRRSE